MFETFFIIPTQQNAANLINILIILIFVTMHLEPQSLHVKYQQKYSLPKFVE